MNRSPQSKQRISLGKPDGHRAPSTRGLPGVESLAWFRHHLRGLLLEVGGLQYKTYRLGGPDNPDPWFDPDVAQTLGPGFMAGDLAVSLHVPEGSPIDPSSVHRSMASVRVLVNTVFPTPVRRVLTGSSWMLDDRLGELLGPSSNIVRLARMFHLVPGWLDGDAEIVSSVFRQWGHPLRLWEPGPACSGWYKSTWPGAATFGGAQVGGSSVLAVSTSEAKCLPLAHP